MSRSDPKQAAMLATPDDTEAQFYECLQRGELDRLMGLWVDEDDIACVHPGGPRLVGAQLIREAFGQLFSQSAIDARPVQVRRITLGNAAVHHVLEEVRVPKADGVQVGFVVATNVYTKTPAGWLMVVHHASPGSEHQLQDFSDASATLH